MDRNELHQQIVELADKIGHLNDTLARSRKIHPVEIDLLRLYVRELVAGTEQLAELSGVPKEHNVAPAVAVPQQTIAEPVNLQDLATAAPEEKIVPIVVEKPIETVVAPPAPIIEKMPEPTQLVVPEPVQAIISEPAVPPVVEKVAEPVAPPVAEKILEPVREMEWIPEPPKVEAPIVVDSPAPKAEEPVAAPTPPPAAPPEYKQEEEYTPPQRRQVNIQSDATTEGKFIKPEAGNPVYHTIEEEPEAPSINDRFSQQSDLFQGVKHTDGKGLREMMDLGERFLFIKELFGGDLASFERATDALNGITSMEQAKAYVEGVLRQKYNWEGKEPVVRQLYSIVERKF